MGTQMPEGNLSDYQGNKNNKNCYRINDNSHVLFQKGNKAPEKISVLGIQLMNVFSYTSLKRTLRFMKSFVVHFSK